jgi:abortive infection bacteriophage resistance protein
LKKKKEWKQQKFILGKLKKRSVLFYDETSTSHQLETRRYYHFAGQPYEDYTIPHGKSLSGHFAAGISYEYKTPLIYFDKKLNGDDYRKIISNEIKPSLDKEYGWSDQTGKPLYKFCQDGDSTHTAKETKELLEIFQIPLWDHPAWSPDMNL